MNIRNAAVALAAGMATLTIAACGGGSGGASAADSEAKREQAQLQFARCMRSHGVDIPDPKPGADGGPGNVRIGGPGANAPSPQVFQAADRACRKYLQAVAPKLSPAQAAELRDQALKFARCMRSHGIDMPDPQVATGGGVRITMRVGGPGKGGINPNSAAFRDAQEACKAFQPRKPQVK